MSSPVTPDDRTTVADPLRDRLVMWVGLPVAGALAVWGLKLIARWVADLAWAPFQGVFRLVADLDEPLATVGALVIGAVGGLVLAFLGHLESLVVVVDGEAVEATKDGRTRSFGRHDVALACVSGKELVLFAADTGELLRERTEADRTRLAAAFRVHGYPWSDDGDPYADRFKRWVAGVPGLPPGAGALLKARQKARDKNDREDAAALREELARLGVVVRDEKKRQYWRPAGPDPESEQ